MPTAGQVVLKPRRARPFFARHSAESGRRRRAGSGRNPGDMLLFGAGRSAGLRDDARRESRSVGPANSNPLKARTAAGSSDLGGLSRKQLSQMLPLRGRQERASPGAGHFASFFRLATSSSNSAIRFS